MRAVRRQTLIGQVIDQLRAEVESERWPVGGRIPTEAELCEFTGTSRNTVREAVQALVHAGMLERRQGSGTYVLAVRPEDDALAGYFADARAGDLVELREALDVTAAALAATRRDDDDLRELRRLLADRNALWSGEADVDPERAVAADVALHRAVAVASHNALYLDFYDQLIPLLSEHVGRFPVGDEHSHAALHADLVDAIAEQSPDRARAAAQALLAGVRTP